MLFDIPGTQATFLQYMYITFSYTRDGYLTRSRRRTDVGGRWSTNARAFGYAVTYTRTKIRAVSGTFTNTVVGPRHARQHL